METTDESFYDDYKTCKPQFVDTFKITIKDCCLYFNDRLQINFWLLASAQEWIHRSEQNAITRSITITTGFIWLFLGS